MAKGVDVENYPGMPRENGGKMIEVMKRQAKGFFAEIRDTEVQSMNLSVRPFEVNLNGTSVRAHTVILATGANSRWLEAEGEYEYRGHGVSSCAACDGFLFMGKPCAVIGGGDTAMEEALMLSRICSEVTLIHRRDQFRASLVLQDRVRRNAKISVWWNSAVARFAGRSFEVDGEMRKALSHLEVRSTTDPTEDLKTLRVDAAFVAIGHTPNTEFALGMDMDDQGYLTTEGKSTRTSVAGVFAAGDVADHVYRQAVTSAGSGAMAALDAERYLSENPVDEETCVQQSDFSKWTLKELRSHMDYLGLKCNACSEKSDFVSTLVASL